MELIKRYLRKTMFAAQFRAWLPGRVPRGVSFELDMMRLFNANRAGVSVIFDVGANAGQSARRFIDLFPLARIHCFEPVPEIYAKLISEMRRARQVSCHDIGLGESRGVLEMAVFKDPHECGRSRMVTRCPADSDAESAISVTVDTLDHVCGQWGVNRIDILKLDVEGYEAEVLKGGMEFISSGRVRCIYAEVEFLRSKTHGDFFEIDELLRPAGYTVFGFYDWSAGDTARPSDHSNCVWVHAGFGSNEPLSARCSDQLLAQS